MLSISPLTKQCLRQIPWVQQKLISEKLFFQANESIPNQKTMFCSVRFGKCGLDQEVPSFPIMLQQLLNEKPLTVTDPLMTRFYVHRRGCLPSHFKRPS
ncbi:polysaccharide biosynthesis protein [Bacillus sp. SL00103]